VTETEDVPKRLFPDAPDWHRPWGKEFYAVLIADQLHYSWQGPGGWFVIYDREKGGGIKCECPTQEEAHEWLRKKIIAHRDELNRVTGLKDA
jgi:hypothetical protein